MILLLSGLAQSGKDSTANILKEKLLPKKSLIIHNADYLKYIASQYLGWNGEKTEENRTMLQLLGTEKTKIALNKPLFWIEKTCDIIEILKNDFDYFMIPDTRFMSEIYYPKSRFPNDVITIRVHRLNFDNGLTETQKNHISETELVNFKHDYDIISESGLDKLEVEINKFISLYF
jgi:hypothetical protein